MFRLVFVSLLAGLWQSPEVAQCQNIHTYTNVSLCYNTSSGTTCFTTFLAKNSHPVRQPFKEASNWCKKHVPSSSLIVIDSLEKQRTVDVFIRRQVLENETIVIGARKLSANESLKWSWVNGRPTIPIDGTQNAAFNHDGACVELKPGKLATFCFGGSWTLLRFICEYPESITDRTYQQNNRFYIGRGGKVTWYEARNECLRLGRDLASITELRTIENWLRSSKGNETERFWIGLRRNKWVWNRKLTGSAVTCTNWEGGYPDDSSDKQCICISPKCKNENNGTICGDDRKWWTCNCDHQYAIVCQKEEKTFKAATTKFVGTREMLSSTLIGFKSFATTPTATNTSVLNPVIPTVITVIPTVTDNSAGDISKKTDSTTYTTIQSSTIGANLTIRTTTINTTTSTKNFVVSTATEILAVPPSIPGTPTATTSVTTKTDEIAKDTSSKTDSTSFMPRKPQNHYSWRQTTVTVVEPLSTEPFNSLNTTKLLPILIVLVAVLFIIVAVICIIRRRKYDRRNKTPSLTSTKQGETTSSEYATVVPGNRPPEDTTPAANPIYADVEMTQCPPSNNTIYASVQPTSEATDMGKSVVYADLDKVALAVSPIYSEPFVPPTSMNNSEYSEPFKPYNKSKVTAPVPNHYYNIATVDQHNV